MSDLDCIRRLATVSGGKTSRPPSCSPRRLYVQLPQRCRTDDWSRALSVDDIGKTTYGQIVAPRQWFSRTCCELLEATRAGPIGGPTSNPTSSIKRSSSKTTWSTVVPTCRNAVLPALFRSNLKLTHASSNV